MNATASAVASMPYAFDELFTKLVVLESHLAELRDSVRAPHPAEPKAEGDNGT